MKITVLRYFYVVLTIVFIAFFFVFSSFLYYRRIESFFHSAAEINLSFDGKIYSARGVQNGNYIFTVAHVFPSELIAKFAYYHINNGTYIHINHCLTVKIDGHNQLCSFVYIDTIYDVAVIFSDTNNQKSLLLPDKKNSALYLSETNPSHAQIKCVTLYPAECDKKEYYSFDGLAVKGQSGLPILTNSGYVIGIICSIDKMYERTYAVPSYILCEIADKLSFSVADINLFN